jgi:hypothetical protein
MLQSSPTQINNSNLRAKLNNKSNLNKKYIRKRLKSRKLKYSSLHGEIKKKVLDRSFSNKSKKVKMKLVHGLLKKTFKANGQAILSNSKAQEQELLKVVDSTKYRKLM